jgi:adenylate kinase
MNPREIKLASLLLKPDALVKKVDLDYIGMEIPNDFIVGFGLDYDGYGRNLRDIYSVVEEQQQTGNMLNLVLFGPPGAGKGTQAEFLTESYKLIHLSTGDLLRSEIAGKTPLGMEAKRYMDKGELVPDAVVIGMIRSKLEANPGANGYVFDGFPRTVSQAEALDALLEEKGSPVSGMLSLEVERLELINRLLGRGLMSGRSDDLDQEVIENRIRVYGEKTAPLIEYYEKQGKYFSINGMGSILEIAGRLKNTVDKLVKN